MENNEYNSPVKETNDVDEFQNFDAVEYYKVPEIDNSTPEVVKVEEQDSANRSLTLLPQDGECTD